MKFSHKVKNNKGFEWTFKIARHLQFAGQEGAQVFKNFILFVNVGNIGA
jgi:hypothetical protein